MKTPKYVKTQLAAIMEAANLDPKLEAPLKAISAAVDEYAAELANHGEAWDAEAEDFEFKAKAPAVNNEGAEKWENAYNDLKARYTEAFLFGTDPNGNAGNVPPPPADPIQPQGETEKFPTIDSLLIEAE